MKISQPMLIGMFIVLAIVAYLILANAPGPYDSFARCLAENGVKMYGASWCPHCNDEKHMFGASWRYMDYVECGAPDGSELQVCKDAGVTAYPTWEFANGTKEAKVFSLEELGARTGCPLTEG